MSRLAPLKWAHKKYWCVLFETPDFFIVNPSSDPSPSAPMASSSSYSFLSLLLILVVSFSSSISSAPDGALVASLPGFDGTFPSKHYAG